MTIKYKIFFYFQSFYSIIVILFILFFYLKSMYFNFKLMITLLESKHLLFLLVYIFMELVFIAEIVQ